MKKPFCQAHFITSIDHLSPLIPDELQSWIDDCKKDKIIAPGKHLLADTQKDIAWGKAIQPYGQNVRILPHESNFNMDFAIVDDVLGITSFDPLFVVVIHSQKITDSATALFDLTWMQGKELK